MPSPTGAEKRAVRLLFRRTAFLTSGGGET